MSGSNSTWRDRGTLFSTYATSHHSNNKTNVLPTFQVHNLLTGNLLLSTFFIRKKRCKNKKTLKRDCVIKNVKTFLHLQCRQRSQRYRRRLNHHRRRRLWTQAKCLCVQGRRQGFRPGWSKFGAKRRKKFFRLPTLVFSLPTLPYVTVAHPAHRTEADLREKASLARAPPLLSSPLPSLWPSLTVRPSYTHAWSMTTGKR